VGYLAIVLYCKLYTECASRRILKIGYYMAKMLSETKWDVVFETLCVLEIILDQVYFLVEFHSLPETIQNMNFFDSVDIAL